MHSATEATEHSLRLTRLESLRLSATILPEVGGKILSLADRTTGREFLWKNPRVAPQRFPIDANFDNYWCGGWDDAFPTADACEYRGEQYPNLGELRSIEWKVESLMADSESATVRLSAFAPISPVKATKTVSLRDEVLSMRFEVENLGPLGLDFLWGTHPAFSITAGTRLILPARTGIVSLASDPILGVPGTRYTWPMLGEFDMSRVPGIEAGLSCGHYATDLEAGWFAVEGREQGIVFTFPLEKCPHLWLWLVYGGWRGYYHAIIEPWTGYPVNLTEAVRESRHRRLDAGETFEATVRCMAYSAPEQAAAAAERLQRLSNH